MENPAVKATSKRKNKIWHSDKIKLRKNRGSYPENKRQ